MTDTPTSTGINTGSATGSADAGSRTGPAAASLRPAYRWYAAAGAVVLAAAAAGAMLYPGLPDSLPMHWNGAGQADSFASKSFWSVFAAPLIGAGMVVFLLGTAAVLPRLAAASGRADAPAGPAASAANIRATQFFMGATTFALSLLFAWLALRGWLLPPDGTALEFLLPTLGLFLAMAGIGLAAWRRYRREVAAAAGFAGQLPPDAAASAAAATAAPVGAAADAPVGAAADAPVGAAVPGIGGPAADPVTDRSNYRAGIYVNRADPRVVVPKRLGAGWSLNAARPAGLAFYLLIGLVSLAGLVAGIAFPLLAG